VVSPVRERDSGAIGVLAMPGKYADNEKCQDFVANLKAEREARRWSQERLAAESHCTVTAAVDRNLD
jgi:hypothetical protein